MHSLPPAISLTDAMDFARLVELCGELGFWRFLGMPTFGKDARNWQDVERFTRLVQTATTTKTQHAAACQPGDVRGTLLSLAKRARSYSTARKDAQCAAYRSLAWVLFRAARHPATPSTPLLSVC